MLDDFSSLDKICGRQARLSKPSLTLLCLHCAGCDGTMYTSRLLDGRNVGNSLIDFGQQKNVELLFPTLKGRAHRRNETLLSLHTEAEEIYDALVDAGIFPQQATLRTIAGNGGMTTSVQKATLFKTGSVSELTSIPTATDPSAAQKHGDEASSLEATSETISGIASSGTGPSAPNTTTVLPLGIVGHSMGGSLAFELIRLLFQRASCRPAFLIVSASGDPADKANRPWPKVKDLSDEDLKTDLVKRWGMRPAAARPEIWRIIKGMCRNDLTVLDKFPETYDFQSRPTLPADLPVYGFVGEHDYNMDVAYMESIQAWNACNYTCQMVPKANHALYHNLESRDVMFAHIKRIVSQYLDDNAVHVSQQPAIHPHKEMSQQPRGAQHEGFRDYAAIDSEEEEEAYLSCF